MYTCILDVRYGNECFIEMFHAPLNYTRTLTVPGSRFSLGTVLVGLGPLDPYSCAP